MCIFRFTCRCCRVGLRPEAYVCLQYIYPSPQGDRSSAAIVAWATRQAARIANEKPEAAPAAAELAAETNTAEPDATPEATESAGVHSNS